MSPTPEEVRAILREQNLCGFIAGSVPHATACVLGIGHDDNVHEVNEQFTAGWNAAIHSAIREAERIHTKLARQASELRAVQHSDAAAVEQALGASMVKNVLMHLLRTP